MEHAQVMIGKLARESGVNRETIRYYEHRGLLAPPLRTRAGYRLYPSETLRRVRFIKRAQVLGFSLDEIAGLLSLQVDPTRNCIEVKGRAERKIVEIEARITALAAMKQALAAIATSCEGQGSTVDCPILDMLNDSKEFS